MSDFLWSHGLQHARLPCSSLSPRGCSASCPLSRWCYLTISSSATSYSPFPFNLSQHQCFPMSRLFTSGSQSIGASASGSVLPMNIRGWFPLGLTSLLSKGFSRVFSSTTVQKHQFFGAQPSLWFNSHIFMVHISHLLEKSQLWLYGSLSAKWCLCSLICCVGFS